MTVDRRCPSCGTSLAEWVAKNRTGCPECYKTFCPEIMEYLRRMQGIPIVDATEPAPSPDSQRSQLEAMLSDAITREEYEMAAKIRDKLNSLKRSISNI
jgi:protein arginine kinase activator